MTKHNRCSEFNKNNNSVPSKNISEGNRHRSWVGRGLIQDSMGFR